MISTRTLCGIFLVSALIVPVAKADLTESIVFTGTATCSYDDGWHACTIGNSAPITGYYSLDVTTQEIVGAWSFSTPFLSSGVMSSGMDGAGTEVYLDPTNSPVVNVAVFDVASPSSGINEYVELDFPAADFAETGPVYTGGNGDTSGVCQWVTTLGCSPDVTITGDTTVTPEPPSFELLFLGMAGTLGMILVLRRI